MPRIYFFFNYDGRGGKVFDFRVLKRVTRFKIKQIRVWLPHTIKVLAYYQVYEHRRLMTAGKKYGFEQCEIKHRALPKILVLWHITKVTKSQ